MAELNLPRIAHITQVLPTIPNLPTIPRAQLASGTLATSPSLIKGRGLGWDINIEDANPRIPPLSKEGLVASVPLASYALGNLGKLGIVGNTCVMCAILGKLSSAIVRWLAHKPNPYCLGLKSRLCRLCLHSSPNPSFDKGGACCTFSKCELCSGYYG